jgi:hypothetical protein
LVPFIKVSFKNLKRESFKINTRDIAYPLNALIAKRKRFNKETYMYMFSYNSYDVMKKINQEN